MQEDVGQAAQKRSSPGLSPNSVGARNPLHSQPATFTVARSPSSTTTGSNKGMASNTRYSTYSLTADRIPEWLIDEPFDFDDTHTPPSYLIASLQEAFNDSYDQQPPTYDNIVGTSSGVTRRRVSVAGESMWDDSDSSGSDEDVTSDAADDEHDDEDDAAAYGRVGSPEHPRYAGLWASSTVDRISEDEESLSTPTASSSARSSALPSPPSKGDDGHSRLDHAAVPPAYHLLHLQPLTSSGLREDWTSYHDFATSLASLDSQLLLAPFSAFADACYEASVLGDTSPATLRPFSPSPQRVRALPPVPVLPSSSAKPMVDDEEDTDEDDEVPKSPAQTFNVISSSPVIWDPKVEEHSRSRSELPISMSRSISAPYFLPPSQDVLSSPTSESGRSAQHKSSKADTMAEVAALFLRGPIHVGAQESVSASPTRREPSKRSRSQSRPRTNGSTKMKGLLRSFNISQPRWLPS